MTTIAAPRRSSARSVTAICALCSGIGSLLGFIPGFIATSLRADLEISQGQVGLLVGLYYGSTGVGSILGGRLTDRFGARSVVAADMLIVVVAAGFGAAVGTYWALVVAAVVAGSGYALVNAGTNVAVAHSVPTRRRTLAMAVRTAGVPAIGAIAAAVGPTAAERWGWRSLLTCIALCAVPAALGAMIILSNDRSGLHAGRSARGAALPAGFIWFPVGAFLLIAGTQPLYSWIVPYLEQSLEASPGVAGGVSALASLVGVAAMILNALRSDQLGADRRISRIGRLLVLMAGATLLVALGQALGVGVTLVGMLIGVAAQLSAIAMMHAIVVDRVPHAVATATGWTMTGYYLGALLSPVAFGFVVDATDTFAWSWIVTVALILLSIPAWIAAGRVTKVER